MTLNSRVFLRGPKALSFLRSALVQACGRGSRLRPQGCEVSTMPKRTRLLSKGAGGYRVGSPCKWGLDLQHWDLWREKASPASRGVAIYPLENHRIGTRQGLRATWGTGSPLTFLKVLAHKRRSVHFGVSLIKVRSCKRRNPHGKVAHRCFHQH